MGLETRRSFLKQAAAAGAAATGGSLGLSAGAADEPLAMAIAHWNGGELPEEKVQEAASRITRQAIEALGGMGRFVNKNDVVCVKPNMAWDRTPEQAANTNPGVVSELVKMALEAGAKTVRVGDYTCNEAAKSYVTSGIAEAAKAAGAEVFFVDESRFRQVEVGGKVIDKIGVYPAIVDADLVINCPIAKHHRLSQATLCMKNYMGVVDDRKKFHQDLATAMTDITAYMKPRLCVLDAMRILTAGGPTGGNLADVKRMDTIAAGTDIVALDAFGAKLLGNDPAAIGTVKSGFEAGLGQIDYTKIAHKEIAVA